MHKRPELTEEQFFKRRSRYVKIIAGVNIFLLVVCICFGLYVFFTLHGTLRNYHIAHWLTAGFFFIFAENVFSFPKQLLTKGKRGEQFYPQLFLQYYERTPQWLKKFVDRERSRQPEMLVEEAMLRVANKIKWIARAFSFAAVICIAIGLYRLYSNLQELAYMLYFKEMLEVISS